MKAWWEGLFFPLHPVQCLLHREPVKNNAKCVVPSKTQPLLYHPLHSLFSTDLMHRSHNPGPCSCWSDLCCTRYFCFKYSFIKHEVRPLLTSRVQQSLVSSMYKPQPIKEVNIPVITGESGRYHKIGFPGMPRFPRGVGG